MFGCKGTFTIALGLFLLWAVGQTARDDWWLTGLCFYIPSVALATFLVLVAGIFAWRGRRRCSLLVLVLAVPPLVFVVFVENHLFRTVRPAAAPARRLVHWNVGGTMRPWGAQPVLKAQRADIYVLSELWDPSEVDGFRAGLGASYQAIVFGNMAVVARGRVASEGWRWNRDRRYVHAVRWEYGGQSVQLFVVDLPSDIRVWRAPLLARVAELVQRERPDLVVGDFNAPRRSRGLATLPPGYSHAYDAAGRGIGYTWPVPCPVYALDQCIVSPRVTPVRYRLGTSLVSDHRFQILDFVLRSQGE